MAESFSEFIEKLLARTNIVHVVSRYIPLKKKGNRWWGCCPFHHEKEPSFTVSEDKQFYYCFGCQETGNAITFVEKMESIERIDAIKRLAEEAKMEMPEFKGTREKEVVSREKRERLYSLMKETARHYHENLSKPGAKNATDYIKTRGIPDNLVTRFGLGVSLNGSEIISHLESKG
ncbi:MAG: DNA primase, partial [Clostridia bacterium]|nr:DNA primase [Clostridia bacterium]